MEKIYIYVAMAAEDYKRTSAATGENIPLPANKREAVQSPYWLSWKAAMDAEIHVNLKIGVGLVPKPRSAAQGHTLIGSTWVYTTKVKEGKVVFKARLTACGNMQKEADINPDHRASPTADQDSIRLILAELANLPGAKFLSFDFVRAYLQAKRPADAKPIFIRIPGGYEADFPDQIFLLGVNLYGLVEAAYRWYKELCSGMDKLGWTQCRIDSCVWFKLTPNGPVYAAVHVDDGVMAGFDVDAQIAALQTEYKMTVNLEPKELLGTQLEIPPQNRGLLGLHQSDHVKKILEFWENHPILPMPTKDLPHNERALPYIVGLDLRNLEQAPTEDLECWHVLTGQLQWLTTRPEVAFIIKELSRAIGHVTAAHKQAEHALLKYLHSFPDLCLTYGKDPHGSPVPGAAVDAEHGYDCVNSGRASHGFGVFCKKGLVCHKCATQPCATTSSTDAEVVGLSDCAKRVQKLRNYLRDRAVKLDGPSIIQEDNKGAVDYSRNPSVTRNMRHITQRSHYARELQQMGEIDIQHCSTQNMLADIFTKALPYEKFQYCRTALGLLPLAELKAFNAAITNSDPLSDFDATVLSSFAAAA